MNNESTLIREALIVKLMRGFPSSQSQITEGTIKAYLEATEDCGLEALEKAVKQFLGGKVKGRNEAFLPPAPELAVHTREVQEEIDSQAIVDKTTFIETSSPEWSILCKRRGRSMPQVERGTKIGWYVPKDEVAEITPQMIEDERALLEHREPRSIVPLLRRMGE